VDGRMRQMMRELLWAGLCLPRPGVAWFLVMAMARAPDLAGIRWCMQWCCRGERSRIQNWPGGPCGRRHDGEMRTKQGKKRKPKSGQKGSDRSDSRLMCKQ